MPGFDFDWVAGLNTEENTPVLYRPGDEQKEINLSIDAGNKPPKLCYLCGRLTTDMVVFSPYPPTGKHMQPVKEYRAHICCQCAIDHDLVPKPES